jgi:hypothetical protein
MQKQIDKLTELSTQTAAQHAETEAARQQAREAEADLLTAMIAKVLPALPAISRSVKTKNAWTSGANGCNPVERKSFREQRGLLVVDKFDREKDSSGNRGDFTGERLFILEDGTLLQLDRSGSWSQWQGEWSSWETEQTALTPREAVNRYNARDIIEALIKALEVHVATPGGAETERANAEAFRRAAEALK